MQMKRMIALALMMALVVSLSAAVAVAAPGKGAGQGKGQEKVTLCHKGKTITVAAPAAKGHMKHGDTVGPCATTPPAPTEPAPTV